MAVGGKVAAVVIAGECEDGLGPFAFTICPIALEISLQGSRKL